MSGRSVDEITVGALRATGRIGWDRLARLHRRQNAGARDTHTRG
jgi:hypothetical protein